MQSSRKLLQPTQAAQQAIPLPEGSFTQTNGIASFPGTLNENTAPRGHFKPHQLFSDRGLGVQVRLYISHATKTQNHIRLNRQPIPELQQFTQWDRLSPKPT